MKWKAAAATQHGGAAEDGVGAAGAEFGGRGAEDADGVAAPVAAAAAMVVVT